MVGPGQPGGMLNVIERYLDSPLAAHYDIRFLRTTSTGSFAARLTVALSALARAVPLALSRPRPLFHIHTASGRSFQRKSGFMATAWLFRCPFVVHVHGGAFVDWATGGSPLRRRLVRSLLRRPGAVVVLSEQWKTAMTEVFGRGDATVIPSPVRVPAVARAPRQPEMVLFAGRLVAMKGVFDLLEAARILQERGRRVEFVLAGEGEESGRLKALVEGLPVPALVSVPGWVPWERLEQLLGGCTLFCLPSHREALGLSLLEAMIAGVPCVATDVGGIPSFLFSGINGLLVKPGDPAALADAIARLLDDPEERERLGRAAREHVRGRYETDRVVEQVEQVYAALGYPPQSAGAPPV